MSAVTVEGNTWQKVRDALVEAFVGASGFDAEHVLWAYQDVNQPKGAYIDLAITATTNPGIDGVAWSSDDKHPDMVKLSTVGTREAVLQVEVYTDTTVTSADEGADALAVVERLRSAFVLPGLRDRLAKFKVALLDIEGDATYAPTIVRAGFRGKAVWDIRVNLDAVVLVQYIEYFTSISGSVTAHGGMVDPDVRPFALP